MTRLVASHTPAVRRNLLTAFCRNGDSRARVAQYGRVVCAAGWGASGPIGVPATTQLLRKEDR
jgi:hypothetical protein